MKNISLMETAPLTLGGVQITSPEFTGTTPHWQECHSIENACL